MHAGRLKSVVTIILFIGALMTALPAYAIPPSFFSPSAAKNALSTGGAKNIPAGESGYFGPSGFERIINGMVVAGQTIGSRAAILGGYLMRAMLLIAIGWFGIKVALGVEGSGFESALGTFITQIFMWGIIVWLFKQYNTITGQIVHGFTFIGAFITSGKSVVPSTTTQAMGYILPGIHMLHMVGNIFASIGKLPWGAGGWSPGAHIANFGVSLQAMVILVVVGLIGLVAAGLYIIISLISVMLVSIALAIGPIFIPFALTEVSAFLFQGWTRFLFVAAMWRLVGAVILGLIQTLLPAIADPTSAGSIVFATGGGEYGISYIAAIGDILMAIVLALMVLEIPVVANGLVSGAPSIRMPGGFDLVKTIGKVKT